MYPLSEEEKAKITRILKRKNRHIWSDDIIPFVIQNIENIRSGRVSLSDHFVPDVLTWREYVYELALHKFI